MDFTCEGKNHQEFQSVRATNVIATRQPLSTGPWAGQAHNIYRTIILSADV